MPPVLRHLPPLLLAFALGACDQFEDPDVAVIESIDPDSGAVGSLVVIQADNLFDRTRVIFHDDVASPVAAVFSDERVVTIVPEGATAGQVRLETAGQRGASRADFKVVPAPPSTPAFFDDDVGSPVTDFIPCTNRTATDDGYAQLTLPFAFPFYGRPQTEMFVATNGLISFGQPRPCDNSGGPQDFATADKIVVLGYDLSPGDHGQVLANVSDLSKVVVTWSEVALFLLPETSNTMQAVLFPDGRIRMNFGYISTRGIGAVQPLLNNLTGSLTGLTPIAPTDLVEVTFTVQPLVDVGPSEAVDQRFFVDRFFDLENRSLLFTPLDTGGVFAGYRAELLPPE
jgi:hypothetical protein